MKALNEEEFIAKYESTGYLPHPMQYRGKGKLNIKSLKTKYKEYCKKVEALNNKPKGLSYQKEWDECREAVYARDNHECQLWGVLTEEEKKIAVENGYYGQFKRITPAHFLFRSTNPKLKCEVDNVYTISLMFHSWLDENRSPLTGEYIGKQRVLEEWWKRILPTEIYEKYKDLY